jgi:hypothetical protein
MGCSVTLTLDEFAKMFGYGAWPDPTPTYSGPTLDTIYGWRYWAWSPSRKTLCSPMYRSIWRHGELRALNWKTEDRPGQLRDVCGIHAVIAPVEWWNAQDGEIQACGEPLSACGCKRDDIGETAPKVDDEISITGLVERVRRYVLGERGWRAEWVVIRELLAPTTEIGLDLEQAFPGVLVRYKET